MLSCCQQCMWLNKLKQHGHGPKKMVDVLCACDSTSFLDIRIYEHVLLQQASILMVCYMELINASALDPMQP